MAKAIQLQSYGGIDVLEIVDLPVPTVEAGDVLVRVVAAGTNPGEISIREGYLQAMFPMDFPFGQGTDFAGRVEAVGAGVTGFAVGDEVLGFVNDRSAQAEYVLAEAKNVIRKPPSLDWYRAGSLYVAGTTAVAAVRAVALKRGDVVVISGAAGGVGSIAVQLAVRSGARTIGITSPRNERFLRSVGAEHVASGAGVEERLRDLAPSGITAWIDLYGDGYVDIALTLGVAKDRINTIIDFAAAEKYDIQAEGSAAAGDAATLAYLANSVAWGEIVVPIAAIYPFAAVHDAYRELGKRKAHGKIVLAFDETITQPLHPSAPS
jgi:NADPH:quinone reductase-like Zn-dependent oxidoreductase